MRYRRTYKKNELLIIISICFLFFICIGYSAYNQTLKISGSATMGGSEECPIIEITLSGSWQEEGKYNYVYSVKITNNSDQDIDGWRFGVKVPDGTEMPEKYNPTGEISNGFAYTSPFEYNKLISVGKTINFQFTLLTDDPNFQYTKVVFENGNSGGNTGGGDSGGGESGGGDSGGGSEEVIEPSNIVLDYNQITLVEGSLKQLTATIEPQGATGVITWESSDISVATVTNTGEITAVAPGNAVITAKIGDISATCDITVKEKESSTGGVSVECTPGNPWGTEGDYTRQLDFTVKNDSAEAITGWQFLIYAPEGSKIANYWNCTYEEIEGGFILINGTYNGYVEPNGSVSFGIQITTPEENYIPEISNIQVES